MTDTRSTTDPVTYYTYMENPPLTPGDDTDPGCFTDEEFIEFLTEQGFWVDNLIEN